MNVCDRCGAVVVRAAYHTFTQGRPCTAIKTVIHIDPRELVPANLLPAIQKGITPGSYRCGRGYSTTYQGAIHQQMSEAERLLMGEPIGRHGALASRIV